MCKLNVKTVRTRNKKKLTTHIVISLMFLVVSFRQNRFSDFFDRKMLFICYTGEIFKFDLFTLHMIAFAYLYTNFSKRSLYLSIFLSNACLRHAVSRIPRVGKCWNISFSILSLSFILHMHVKT